MPSSIRTIEADGEIDEQSRLALRDPLPILGPSRIRVIILVPEMTEPTEEEWLEAMMRNSAFDFLKDPAEEMYSPTDGKPYGG